MEINLHEITIRELVTGFQDNGEEGVYGYGGRLNIRPPYQREFVYDTERKRRVIESIMGGFPLNAMYWSVNPDGSLEVLDGQQRIMTICEYHGSNMSYGFKIDGHERGFASLTGDEQKKFLDEYKLMVYFCYGSDREKLAWFRKINVAGLELKEQELRNAVYSGSWVTDAKRYFSRSGGPAQDVGGKYLTGAANRQEYLETAISWISGGQRNIDDYMRKHQHDPNANELWLHFRKVIDWVDATFPKYSKYMKGIDWGILYDGFHGALLDVTELGRHVEALMIDDEVQNKKGIYAYVLSGDMKTLNLRQFPDHVRESAYKKQDGICPLCGKHFGIGEMEADHIIPWSKGGKTVQENCQMLCRACNRSKSDK